MESMNLDEPIQLTDKDKNAVSLPLRNILRLTMIYLRPLVDEYIAELGKGDLKNYMTAREAWDNIFPNIMEKLGVGKGEAILK